MIGVTMNEVEKMYRNSGIKKIELDYPDNFEPFYPEFTAEKQLFLLQLLAKESHITIGLGLPWGQYDDSWWTVTSKNGGLGTNAYKFEEALASFVNSKWQDLTDTERTQIKEILE